MNTNKILLTSDIKNSVHDLGLQGFLLDSLEKFPDYFWTSSASRSGKYHHPSERANGGLVLHTRRLIKLAKDFVTMYQLNVWEQDILVAACVLHDSFCRGVPPDVSSVTVVDHPLYPPREFPFVGYANKWISEKVYDELMLCVTSHSGRWSPYKTMDIDKKLPNIFKIIDYVGSRDYIEISLE